MNQLSCPERDWEEDKIVIVKCSPQEIPKDLVESDSDLSLPENSESLHHQQLWSLHSYPGAGAVEQTVINQKPSTTYTQHTSPNVLSQRSYSYPSQDQQDHTSFEAADISSIHSEEKCGFEKDFFQDNQYEFDVTPAYYPCQDMQEDPQICQHTYPGSRETLGIIESSGGDSRTGEYPDSQSSHPPTTGCEPHRYLDSPPPAYLSSRSTHNTTGLKSVLVLPQYTESPPPSYSDAMGTRGGMLFPG